MRGRALVLLAAVALAACGGGDKSDSGGATGRSRRTARASDTLESTSRDTAGATASPADLPAKDRTGAPRVLFLGTSLTAGLGLADPARDAYPAVLQRMADSLGIPALIVNAGLSGETSAGALRRVDWLLREKPDVFVLETGANDGLRGLDPDSTAANIRAIIEKVRAANPGVKILLIQMEAPTNLGAAYTERFHAIFSRVASAEKVPLSPFLLANVAGIQSLNQADGIHPTPAGARIAARNVWPALAAELRRRSGEAK